MNETETQPIDSTENQFEACRKYYRNSFGLLNCVKYTFNEDGSVNWRAMIKPEFIYPNREWFERNKQPVPDSLDGLEDRQLLIMLGGIKDLAKIRGFERVCFDVLESSKEKVVVKCNIIWIPNYESRYTEALYNGPCYEEIASASIDNTDEFGMRYAETIACNRAFVRCVRNFLGINIVGADELDKSKNKVSSMSDLVSSSSNVIPVTPQGVLEKSIIEKLAISSFEEFKDFLRKRVYPISKEDGQKALAEALSSAKNWNSYSDISAKDSRILMKVINSLEGNG